MHTDVTLLLSRSVLLQLMTHAFCVFQWYACHSKQVPPFSTLAVQYLLLLQVGVLDMLYQKSMRLGVDVRNARGIGAVVNLQSNDASKVWMMPTYIHLLWNAPFQACSPVLAMHILASFMHRDTPWNHAYATTW